MFLSFFFFAYFGTSQKGHVVKRKSLDSTANGVEPPPIHHVRTIILEIYFLSTSWYFLQLEDLGHKHTELGSHSAMP